MDLIWTDDVTVLAGGKAAWYPDLDVIAMSPRLTQVERRCSLAHELAHREHRDRPTYEGRYDARQEAAADLWAARYLIDVHALSDALRWSQDAHEVAEELWVTRHLLRVRLTHLHPAERHHLSQQLT